MSDTKVDRKTVRRVVAALKAGDADGAMNIILADVVSMRPGGGFQTSEGEEYLDTDDLMEEVGNAMSPFFQHHTVLYDLIDRYVPRKNRLRAKRQMERQLIQTVMRIVENNQ